MSKRLEVLKRSLKNKEAKFDSMLENHFATVKQANGQPLNDKRNGAATLNKWEKQNNALRNLDESKEKTKRAIDREECLIAEVEHALMNLPDCIVKAIDSGDITQWKKHPNTFFVPGVEGCRLVWDKKKNKLMYKRPTGFSDADQWKKFAQAANKIIVALAEESQLKSI